MFRSIFVTFVAFAFVLSLGPFAPQPADARVQIGEFEDFRLFMEAHTAGRLQAISDDDLDLDADFQHALGNIGFSAEAGDYAELFFDATMASRVHNDKFWGHQGYIIGKKFPQASGLTFLNPVMEHIDIKAGHMVLDFGDHIDRRSLNAEVQRNPLIGNSIVSPHSTEAGLEIIHDGGTYRLVGGISSGVPTDDFDDDADFAYHVKASLSPLPNLTLSGSYFTVSHGGTTSGPKSNLFSTDRLGEAYADVALGSDGQISVGEGADVRAWQLDLGFEPTETLAFHAFYGNVKDDEVDGWVRFGNAHRGDSETDYWSVEGSFEFLPYWTAAARYSVADFDEVFGNSDDDGKIDRWQLGVNVWMTPRMLMKVEYVDQDARGFDTAYEGGFDGVISEVSYSF